MNTYVYRDSRRQRLTDALAALTEDQVDFRALLEAELAALQSDDWTVADTTYLAVGLDWLWMTRLGLKGLVDDDPALIVLGQTSLLTDAQAAAVENVPQAPGGVPFDYLDNVRAAVDQDEGVLAELLQAAHRRWLLQSEANRLHPFDDVGVMLPLRLETLFDAPDTPPFNEDLIHWKLSLRVIPDEASICRDNAFVSDGEQAALIAFWQSVQQPGDISDTWLDGDVAAVAWQLLCDQVTPERAAWLVSTIEFHTEGAAVVLDLPADMPSASQPNRVGGLPRELDVFAIEGGVRHVIGRLHVTDNPNDLRVSIPKTLDERKSHWWADWKKAKDIGLGGEWLLPEGTTPHTLSALYVVGLGEEHPLQHFKTQVDAGEFGILRLGAPTNSVQGRAAADLGRSATDWRSVAQVRLRLRLDPLQTAPLESGRAVQLYLTDGELPFFAGADAPDDTRDSRRMVRALWPALWGHWLHDLWETGDDAYRAGGWAFNYLCPEGPLMPIRIDDQPYGLLPVTALSQWQADEVFLPESQAQRAVEMNMARMLSDLRVRLANAVRQKNSVVGKSSREFMQLLGQDAVSRDYMWRVFFRADWLFPFHVDAVALTSEFYRTTSDIFGHDPTTPYLAITDTIFNQLPLVQPNRMIYRHQNGDNRQRVPLPEFVQFLFNLPMDGLPETYDLDSIFHTWRVLDGYGDYKFSTLPDSLLIRLLINASQTAYEWRRTQTGSAPEQHVLDVQQKAALLLSEMIDVDDPAWRIDERDPLNMQPVFTLKIPEERLALLERAFRSTLDTAAHRIDPWITGFAWQRLKQTSVSPRRHHRLGAYGWVEGPFDGRPGPTDAGRLHTPSYNQTLAALILRDKFLSSDRAGLLNDNGDNPWAMNISSSKARLAEEIADEVRMGFHLYEVLGRHVEHIIAAPQTVRQLRTSDTYAMYPERKDPNEVCNGYAALWGLLLGDADFPINADQQRALLHIVATLDTYSDLLMADGVMHLVNRQIDRAAESMDAAAGLSRPPSFEFTRTPPSGYQLESVVVSALPFVSVDGLDETASPGRIADPSVAAFLEGTLGSDWAWQAVNADDESLLGSVSLASFGLAPIDTLSLSDDLLRDLVRRSLGLPLVYISQHENRAWTVADAAGNPLGRVTLIELDLPPEELTTLDDATLHARIRTALAVPDDALIEDVTPADVRLWIARDERGGLLGMASAETLGLTSAQIDLLETPELHRLVRQSIGVPQVRIDAPRQHQLAQQLVAALGSRPAAGRDLTQDKAEQGANDTSIYGELRARYERLHAACKRVIDDLRDALDDEQRAAALGRAVIWGITPITEPEDRESLMAALLGQNALPTSTPLSDLAVKATDALEKRWTSAPLPADLPTEVDMLTPLPTQEEQKKNNIPDGVPTLARAIANLAAPNSKLAVLACWSQEAFAVNSKLVTAQAEPTLDEDWLTVVAATRSSLARLEALQLELDTPFEAWSSSPGDPWQTTVVQGNVDRRRTAVVSIQMPRFVAAYGTAAAWGGEKVAVGLVDAFSEAIPMAQRTTMTAFGFNAPSARAPQAILLAVPPKLRQRLDTDVLLQILEETREMTHARTARVEDLGDVRPLIPMWLQHSNFSRASVWLEHAPLFE